VSPRTCKHEIEELIETPDLTPAAREGILFRNAERFYNIRAKQPTEQQERALSAAAG